MGSWEGAKRKKKGFGVRKKAVKKMIRSSDGRIVESYGGWEQKKKGKI